MNVLSGAPYGFRYIRRSDLSEARYEILEDEAQAVREVFRRYTEDQLSIGEVARWLTGEKIPTRTGKERWDRSVIWGMLKNPAYVGRAAFSKTGMTDKRPAINRQARLQGRSVSRRHAKYHRPNEEWITIAVPAIVSDQVFESAGRRLAENRRFAARNSKQPSLLMGLAACQSCGYAYYRTSTRTAKRKIYYYRCLGSDDYRYPGGRVCDNKPVRADYLDDIVWGQVTALLADPALARAELDRRLTDMRAMNPATSERTRLERDLTRTTKAITRLVNAYQEDLLTLTELRARMPGSARQTNQSASLYGRSRSAAARPRHLPQVGREPRQLPRPAARHQRDNDGRESPESLTQRGQRSPRRTRAHHHPTLHPRARPPLSEPRLSIALGGSSRPFWPTCSCTTRSTNG